MIITSKEGKTQPSLLDLLGVSGNSGKKAGTNVQSNDLFSQLLKSMKAESAQSSTGKAKTDTSLSLSKANPAAESASKTVTSTSFNALIDPKKSTVQPLKTLSDTTGLPKNETFEALKSLLGSDEDAMDAMLLSTPLLSSLPSDQIKTLIHKAQEYLKESITAKSEEYRQNPESLPKTLIGLVRLADKLGLEPQSITLSSFTPELQETLPMEAELLSQPLLEMKSLSMLQTADAQNDPSPLTETFAQLISALKKEDKTLLTTGTTEAKKDTQSADAAAQEITQQPLKTLLHHLSRKEQSGTETQTATIQQTSQPVQDSILPNPKLPKNDSLLTLLQGNETQNEPEEPDEMRALSKHESAPLKEGVSLPKTDSLEVKAKEAQQGMRHFASDLKEAVDNYKPPFTRVSMKLNPEKLGEVEVTLVQRGNNVHVNIQSNNTTTVAFLAQNATELKAQLAHQGITNATMNFMSGDGQNGSAQQQQHQNQQNQYKSYQSFEELNLSDEQVSALEIIIPNYA